MSQSADCAVRPQEARAWEVRQDEWPNNRFIHSFANECWEEYCNNRPMTLALIVQNLGHGWLAIDAMEQFVDLSLQSGPWQSAYNVRGS